MSGAHAQHRTPSKPMIDEEGHRVIKLDKYGRPVLKYILIPGPVNANGRPVEYQVFTTFAERHVLDYSPAPHFPSKNARGRMRPRTAKEQRAYRNRMARLVRAEKHLQLDRNAYAAFEAGLAA